MSVRLEKTLTEKEKLVKKVTSESIYEFARFFLNPFLVLESPKFHHEIFELLLKTNRLVLAAPRGFAKSTIVSVIYPVYLACWKKKKEILLVSASEDLAVNWLRKIKTAFGSNRVITFFGDQKSTKWSESHIILKNGVSIRAKGAGGQVKGLRPDMIICDDLETPESVASEDLRKKMKDWIMMACIPALTPDGDFLMIGTVDHPLSVLNDLLTGGNTWEKRIYRAYSDGIQEKGHELWPELWSHERLQQQKKDIGSFAFASQYMNSPISNETAAIKQEHIRYWSELPKQYNAVIAVDPAYSDDSTADYKTASLVLCDTNSNRYLSYYIRTHVPIGEFQDAIINLWMNNKNTVTALGIPNSGTEKGFFDSFMRKCEERKIYPPVVELKNSFTQSGTSIGIRNKHARVVAALQPLFEQGKYFIGSNMTEVTDELLNLGFSKHDDLVDTLAYAEQIIQPHYAEPKIKKVNSWGFEVEDGTRENYGL
jgi:hypothetical protein